MDFSRNWLFINDDLQQKLKEKTIFFAGVGVGSQIAITLSRLGFEKFILADGDTFSLSNINRQHCFQEDINKNKADTIKKYILNINKNSKVETFPYFLKEKDLENFISISDIVINCIDFDSAEYLICHELCKKYDKQEIFVINVGFGSVVAISNDQSISFTSYFNENNPKLLKNKLLEHFILDKNKFSDSTRSKFVEYQNKINTNSSLPEPQIISGCLASSFLVGKILLKIIHQEPVKTFPDGYFIDFND